MVELSTVHGKSLALVLYYEGHGGKAENGAVFFGIARADGKQLWLDRGERGPAFQIPNNALGRLKKVASDDIRIMLEGAKYWTWLTVGDVPKGNDSTTYLPTGLKWPGKTHRAKSGKRSQKRYRLRKQ